MEKSNPFKIMQILLRNDTLCNFCSTEIVIRWLLHFVLHRPALLSIARAPSYARAPASTPGVRGKVRAHTLSHVSGHVPPVSSIRAFIHIHIDSVLNF